jgi:phytoene dehydrogenase-like protein
MAKRVLIIGGGIAGLSTGCYARMNGYEAEIHESHRIPGGLCTTWKRGSYLFDGSLEWLVGTAPVSPFHAYWQEVGALNGVRILDHEVFYQFLGRDGRRLSFYADADRLERHLVELSPADAEPAAHLRRLVKAFASRSLLPDKPMELMGPLDIARLILGMLPIMKDMGYAQKTSVGEFAARFKDPLIREGFVLALALPGCSLLALVATLADFHNQAAGFPYGGSLEFARRIEARYLDLGGAVEYSSKVARILVEDGRAVGVALADGREVRADSVVSTADLHFTEETLLGGAFRSPVHEELFSTAPLYPSAVQVSLGARMDITEGSDAAGTSIELDDPIIIGSSSARWLHVKLHRADSGLAPAGCTVVSAVVPSEIEHWEALYGDRPSYLAEKKRVLEAVTEALERRWPGFRASVEQSDVSSPLTYRRYTGTWRGSFMTWSLTPATMAKFRLIPKMLPGLDNFYQAGMWVMAPGGVPTAVRTARDVVHLICRKDGRHFTTTRP